MKRLTALALTGVLLLATACGGNQTNGTATNGDAGAGVAQQQTSDGAADPTAEATDQILMPTASGSDLYCYAWVVYTENIYPQFDAAYLAHYVKSDGEYLYALPISEPHNADALDGDITAFAFDKMEEAEWTGTIEHFDGSEEEITVPVMEDTVTGRTVLGDLKRKILCADFAVGFVDDWRRCWPVLWLDGGAVDRFHGCLEARLTGFVVAQRRGCPISWLPRGAFDRFRHRSPFFL